MSTANGTAENNKLLVACGKESPKLKAIPGFATWMILKKSPPKLAPIEKSGI